MREITLGGRYTEGKSAFVDDDDFERVSRYKWYVNLEDGKPYIRTKIKQPDGTYKTFKLHRFVMGVTDSTILIDHRNQDTFDNRKLNLRRCTKAENACNKNVMKRNKLGVKGVSRYGREGYRMRIKHGNTKIDHYGYRTVEEAAAAYDREAERLHGNFKRTNVMIQESK